MANESEDSIEVEVSIQESYKDSLIKLQGEKIQMLEARIVELEAETKAPRYLPPPRMSRQTIVKKLEEKFGRPKVSHRQIGADQKVRLPEFE